MTLSIHAERPPLTEIDVNVVHITGTRIPLERVIRAFLQGATPEQIAQDFDVLKLQDVYAVISYYLLNRAEIDAWLAEVAADVSRIRAEIEKQHDPADIRKRLLVRSMQQE